jgi:F-type H+-transporting ATPase subunit b
MWLVVVCWVAFAPRGAAAQEAQAEKTAHAPAADSKHGADAHADAGAKHGGDAHAAGHHDETDLTHGNASAELASPAELKYDMSIYTFVVFVILLGVLYKFAWGPIASALDLREETIQRQIEEARLASDKAAAQLKEYEARLTAATDEARQIVAGARKDAEVAKEKIVAEAREAAGRERDRAVADIHIAKNQALDQIAQKSVQTAVSLASSIIRREVKPQDHEALIGEAVNQFSKLN